MTAPAPAPTLACTIRPWAQFPLDRALRGIRTAGYTAVALPVHGVPAVITPDTPPERAARVGSEIAEHGLDLILLSHAADLDRGDAVALRSLRRQIDHCTRLGVRLLVDMGCPEPANNARYVRLMVAAAPYAAAHGVTIAVKPHGGLTRTAADTLALIERVGHPAFKACWDPGNVLHYGGGSPTEGLAELAPRVVAVGARDHPVRRGNRNGSANGGMPPAITPGDGRVDFVALYRTLHEHGHFTGPSAVESVTKLGTVEQLDSEAERARANLIDALAGRGPTRFRPQSATASRVRRSCSLVARAAAEDPIGTARYFDRFLMLELPPPWPEGMGTPVWETPRVPAPLRAALRAATRGTEERGLTMKTFAAAPDPRYSTPGSMRVLRFDREPGPAAGLSRMEHHVPAERAAEFIEALFSDDAAALAPFSPYRATGDHRDLVVCTHASVDGCCGTYGYPLYRALRDAHGSTGDLRVWRVSSFGGHRFAPTLVDFPEGRVWGNLTPERMGQLVHRTGDPTDLLDLYRGWGCLRHPWEQAVERELLRTLGWEWIGQRLELESALGSTGRDSHDPGVVRVTAHDPGSGSAQRFDAAVDHVGPQPVLMGCDGTPGEVQRYAVALTARPLGTAGPLPSREQ
ncbi:TIM barrel protein [Nocardiopsis rhodophaea]|uniref:TIM barrel protein n=1 Tax=Nocardiopsis rhodophaea TaxID=280238 RepID=UPI0031E1EFDB